MEAQPEKVNRTVSFDIGSSNRKNPISRFFPLFAYLKPGSLA